MEPGLFGVLRGTELRLVLITRGGPGLRLPCVGDDAAPFGFLVNPCLTVTSRGVPQHPLGEGARWSWRGVIIHRE